MSPDLPMHGIELVVFDMAGARPGAAEGGGV